MTRGNRRLPCGALLNEEERGSGKCWLVWVASASRCAGFGVSFRCVLYLLFFLLRERGNVKKGNLELGVMLHGRRRGSPTMNSWGTAIGAYYHKRRPIGNNHDLSRAAKKRIRVRLDHVAHEGDTG
jgi:hypothetical protein